MQIQTVGDELILYPEAIGRHTEVSLEDDSDPVTLGGEGLRYGGAALFTDRGRADHTTVQYVYVIKITPRVVLQRKVLKCHLQQDNLLSSLLKFQDSKSKLRFQWETEKFNTWIFAPSGANISHAHASL